MTFDNPRGGQEEVDEDWVEDAIWDAWERISVGYLLRTLHPPLEQIAGKKPEPSAGSAGAVDGKSSRCSPEPQDGNAQCLISHPMLEAQVVSSGQCEAELRAGFLDREAQAWAKLAESSEGSLRAGPLGLGCGRILALCWRRWSAIGLVLHLHTANVLCLHTSAVSVQCQLSICVVPKQGFCSSSVVLVLCPVGENQCSISAAPVQYKCCPRLGPAQQQCSSSAVPLEYQRSTSAV